MALHRPCAAGICAPLVSLLLLLCMPLALGQQAPGPAAAGAEEQDLINPDRPGIADGSTVIWPHRFQLEIGIQAESRGDGSSSLRTLFVPTLLRLGLSPTWELRVETNGFTQTRSSDPVTGIMRATGYAPISIGAKVHWQDGKGPAHPSLGSILRVFVPSGSSDFGSHRFTADLRLAADWDLTRSGSWSLNPNVGAGYYEDDQGQTFCTALGALTLNYFSRDKKVNPFVDLGLQAPEARGGRTSVVLDTGVAYVLGRNVQLDASVGTGILGHTPPHPFWSVGFSQRF